MASFTTASNSTASEFERDLQATSLCVLAMFASAYALRYGFEWSGLPVARETRMGFTLPRWLDVLTLLAVLPILEELVFRGAIISGLRKLSLGFWPAAVVSSALFAAIHLPTTVHGALHFSALGLLLSLVLYKTGKLWWCIAAHAAFNAVPAAFVLIYLR